MKAPTVCKLDEKRVLRSRGLKCRFQVSDWSSKGDPLTVTNGRLSAVLRTFEGPVVDIPRSPVPELPTLLTPDPESYLDVAVLASDTMFESTGPDGRICPSLSARAILSSASC